MVDRYVSSSSRQKKVRTKIYIRSLYLQSFFSSKSLRFSIFLRQIKVKNDDKEVLILDDTLRSSHFWWDSIFIIAGICIAAC